jgi:hypothetical protein
MNLQLVKSFNDLLLDRANHHGFRLSDRPSGGASSGGGVDLFQRQTGETFRNLFRRLYTMDIFVKDRLNPDPRAFNTDVVRGDKSAR